MSTFEKKTEAPAQGFLTPTQPEGPPTSSLERGLSSNVMEPRSGRKKKVGIPPPPPASGLELQSVAGTLANSKKYRRTNSDNPKSPTKGLRPKPTPNIAKLNDEVSSPNLDSEKSSDSNFLCDI